MEYLVAGLSLVGAKFPPTLLPHDGDLVLVPACIRKLDSDVAHLWSPDIRRVKVQPGVHLDGRVLWPLVAREYLELVELLPEVLTQKEVPNFHPAVRHYLRIQTKGGRYLDKCAGVQLLS